MAAFRPKLTIIERSEIDHVVDQAWKVLEEVGVAIDDQQVLKELAAQGLRVEASNQRVYFSRSQCEQLLEQAPQSFEIRGQAAAPQLTIGGDAVHFDPGSAAVYWLDLASQTHRRATTHDCVCLAKVTEALPRYDLQATGVVPSDIPEMIADCHRLAFALIFGRKPIVTGTFRKESFAIMKAMVEAVSARDPGVASKPLAIFDCCPSPPLRWSELTLSALIACARSGIPAELVAMPLAGATAPITLIGSVIQHTAESLSGVLIHQLYGPGSPIIWGGSPAAFDMRFGTPPMGAMETMMIDGAYAAVGKMLGFPTHAYMACSDAKVPDYQAGMESGMGAVIAALSGINIVSGPGFLNYENTQSLEKLILDHEAIAMALRLIHGIDTSHDKDAGAIIKRHYEDGRFLSDPSTRAQHKAEIWLPGRTVTRCSLDEWVRSGSPWAHEVAASELERLLAGKGYRLDFQATNRVCTILLEAAADYNVKDVVARSLDQELG